MKKKAEHIALIGLLGALALVLGILENLLPPLPGMPPGAKAGLSNLVTMFAAVGVVSGIHMRPAPDSSAHYLRPPIQTRLV